jgi:hypothetical protein
VKNTGNLDLQFQLTGHAKTALAEREISVSWIFSVLADPLVLENDKEDPELMHALGRVPERGDRILRVVYNQTTRPWLVVTAFFDRKAGRIL